MEMADIILVNKADGDLKAAATRTCADYAGALRLMRIRPQDPDGFPKAMMVSALAEQGLAQAWDEIQALLDWRRSEGWFDQTRKAQARYWFEDTVRAGLLARLEGADAQTRLEHLGQAVAEGRISPSKAAEDMLADLGKISSRAG
jgi:LAO/AO transport system kinase